MEVYATRKFQVNLIGYVLISVCILLGVIVALKKFHVSQLFFEILTRTADDGSVQLKTKINELYAATLTGFCLIFFSLQDSIGVDKSVDNSEEEDNKLKNPLNRLMQLICCMGILCSPIFLMYPSMFIITIFIALWGLLVIWLLRRNVDNAVWVCIPSLVLSCAFFYFLDDFTESYIICGIILGITLVYEAHRTYGLLASRSEGLVNKEAIYDDMFALVGVVCGRFFIWGWLITVIK